MTAYAKRRLYKTNYILSMEEVMQYEVHGKPQPIRFRRTSREYSRSYFDPWQKPLPFHSFFHKAAEMNADSNMVKRKCPLESGEEHTIASSSSHECLTRPCTCPDPGKSKEMCVIKKVENWLLGRCPNLNDAEVTESENLPHSTTLSKWPQHINVRPELQKYAESALPSSVLLREVSGSIFPVYILNVRIVGIEPVLTDLFRFVRGHCNHYSCNSTVTDVNWTNAGPLLFGKLARPYCPECCQTRRKRYLSLYFHLELLVEDNMGQMLKLIIERDAAVKFFGCTTYRFLVNPKRRLKIKKMLELLLRVSSAPRTAPVPGASFDFRIMPVAIDHTEQVQLHLYGDNLPLFELVKNHQLSVREN